MYYTMVRDVAARGLRGLLTAIGIVAWCKAVLRSIPQSQKKPYGGRHDLIKKAIMNQTYDDMNH